jgi:hypothetical protein
VVRRHPQTGERHLDVLRWGLLPHFTKDPEHARRPINARAETVTTSGMFRDAFAQRRCLVPASAFYEWRPVRGGPKQPYAIVRADGMPMAFAGLWEGWRGREGQIERTIRDYHDRCQSGRGGVARPDAGHSRAGGLAGMAGRGRGQSGGTASSAPGGNAPHLAGEPQGEQPRK